MQYLIYSIRIFIFLCLTSKWTYSQQNRMQIGQKVPEIVFSKVLNAESKSLKLSDFKGKLVILDFWGIGCTACIPALPVYDALQRKYGDKIRIIPVTYDKAEAVKKFLDKRWPNEKRLSMPFVVDDTSTRKVFPMFSSIPHEIWIDEAGILTAITQGYHVTETNINRVLKGEKNFLPVKEPLQKNIANDLFKDGEAFGEKIAECSYIGKKNDHLVTRQGAGFTEGNKEQFKIFVYNNTIQGLFAYAFGFSSWKRFVFEGIKDSTQYFSPDKSAYPQEYENWTSQHIYCYQLVFQANGKKAGDLKKEGLELMQQDLNRYFGKKYGLMVKREKRKTKCLVLIRTGSDERYKAAGSLAEKTVEGDSYVFKNFDMRNFIGHIDFFASPIVNGTFYENKINISLPVKALKSITETKKILNTYNLDLAEDEREMDVLVFREDKVLTK